MSFEPTGLQRLSPSRDPQMEHPDVAEVAVVGFPHEVKGEGVFAFMVLKKDTNATLEQINDDLKKMVRSKIAGYAIPEAFLVSLLLL